MVSRKYQICKECVMDTTDSQIVFDDEGVCDHCKNFKNKIKPNWITNKKGQLQLEKITRQIKRTSKNDDFDCIIGLSGGIDSSYLTYLAVEKMGLKPHKEDVGQTLGAYGVGPGCYLVLPFLGPSTARDSFGLIADSFVDPFAHITIRENELFGVSGNNLDYFSVKGTSAVDFRADNDTNFESLEKNSLDLYSSFKSIYLQDRENKIKNSTQDQDEWGNLDN